MEDEEYEYEEYKYESKIDKWNRENNTDLSCGTCPRCGSKIYQTT